MVVSDQILVQYFYQMAGSVQNEKRHAVNRLVWSSLDPVQEHDAWKTVDAKMTDNTFHVGCLVIVAPVIAK